MKELSSNGWIKIHRKLQDCWIWQIDKPFDERSAWIDLLMSANHDDVKIPFNGELVLVERGQFITSIRKLSVKWKWNKDKVLKFLRLLESDGMITRSSDKYRTLVTVENYSIYQARKDEEQTPSGTPDGTDNGTEEGTQDGTQDGQQPATNKNDKNDKKDKENINRVSKDTLCQTESVRLIVDEWNTLSEYGIKPVSRLTSGTKRYDSLIARMRKYSIDDVMKAIDNIRHSDFLQGKHSGKPWQITFDWFVLPNNFPKVLEGNYENVQSHESTQPTRNGYGNSRQEQFSRLMESIQRGEQDEC